MTEKRAKSESGVSQTPPCPCCGDHYSDFVWEDETDSAPETDCETGLGYYIHE